MLLVGERGAQDSFSFWVGEMRNDFGKDVVLRYYFNQKRPSLVEFGESKVVCSLEMPLTYLLG